jgi:hypothetical protein
VGRRRQRPSTPQRFLTTTPSVGDGLLPPIGGTVRLLRSIPCGAQAAVGWGPGQPVACPPPKASSVGKGRQELHL